MFNKKLLAALCAGAMLTGETAMPAAAEEDSFLIGDISCDGVVNAEDAAEVLRYCAAAAVDSDARFSADIFSYTGGKIDASKLADINGDGMIDAADAAAILEYAALAGVGKDPSKVLKQKDAETVGAYTFSPTRITISTADLKKTNNYILIPIRLDVDEPVNSLEFGLSGSGINFLEAVQEEGRYKELFELPVYKSLSCLTSLSSSVGTLEETGEDTIWISAASHKPFKSGSCVFVAADISQMTENPGQEYEIKLMNRTPQEICGMHKEAFARYTDFEKLTNTNTTLSMESVFITVSDTEKSSVTFGEPTFHPNELKTSDPEHTQPQTTEPEPTDPAFLPGDVNNDGAVNAKDSYDILIYSAKSGVNSKASLGKSAANAADVNEDGKIDAGDAAWILTYSSALGAGEKAEITPHGKQEAGTIKLGGTELVITLEDLAKINYKPILPLKLDYDKSLGAVEFGLSSNLSFKAVSSDKFSSEDYDIQIYRNLKKNARGTSWTGNYDTNQIDGKNVMWFTDAHQHGRQMDYLYYCVELPPDCEVGDTFTLHFLDKSPVGDRTAFARQASHDAKSDQNWALTGGDLTIKIVDGAKTSSHLQCLYTETEAPKAAAAGDLDGSGTVDIMDVIRMNKFLLGSAELTEEQRSLADLNADKKADSADALLILKIALGVKTK